MSYCLNPNCSKPQNPNGTMLCQSCGSMLLLHQRYRALKLIGQGGFGRTFLAVDGGKPTKPRCVIKQFFPQQQGTTNALVAAELFRQEAKRLKELGKHPQIPALKAYVEQDRQQYLVQEFIEGQNLAEELAEEGAFNEAQIRELLTSLLPVLKFVHDYQIIHRDIKPANIIRRVSPNSPTPLSQGGEVRRKGQLVLVDFGAAKFATGTALLKTGTSIGSAEYTAPEQIRGKAVFASDLYSLGVTCIHLLTQIPPFDLFDSSEDSWVWRDFLINPISDGLGRVLDKLLQSATKRRYQSVNEVLSELKIQPNQRAVASFTRPRTSVNITSQSSPAQSVKTASNPQTRSWLDADLFEDYAQKTPSVFRFQVPSEGSIQPVNHQVNSPTTTPKQLRQALALRVGFATLMIFSTSSLVRLTANHWHETSEPVLPSTEEKLMSESLKTAKPIHSLSKLDSVLSLAISSDGQTLVSGSDINWAQASNLGEKAIYPSTKDSYGSKVRVWDVSTKTLRYTFETQYPVGSVAISPDNQILIASTTNYSVDKKLLPGENGSNQGSIQIWNLRTGKPIRTISKLADDGNYIAIAPDGQTFATSADEKIKLWNLQTGEMIRTLDAELTGVNSLIFSQDGENLASTGYDGTIKLYNPRTGDLISTLEGQIGKLDSIAISADGQTVISGITNGKFGSIATWNVRNGKLIKTFNPPNAVDKVVISPDGKTLASTSWDATIGTIKIWDLETGKPLRTIRAHLSPIDSLTFSSDGKILASDSLDHTIKIWQVHP